MRYIERLFRIIKFAECPRRGRRITEDFVGELVGLAKSASVTKREDEDLFGGFEAEEDNFAERAELQGKIKRRMSRDKRIFGTVARGEKEIKRIGSVDTAEAKNIAAEAKNAQVLFDALKNTPGEMSSMLNEATKKMKGAGKAERESIEDEIYKKVISVLPRLAGFKQEAS